MTLKRKLVSMFLVLGVLAGCGTGGVTANDAAATSDTSGGSPPAIETFNALTGAPEAPVQSTPHRTRTFLAHRTVRHRRPSPR